MAGFTVVFSLATVSVLGVISTLRLNSEVLQRVGGVVTIVMGLVFVGLVPALQRDTRPAPRRIPTLVGLKFSIIIGRERIKRAIQQMPSTTNGKDPSIGFRYFSLDRSNFKVWQSEQIQNSESELVKQLELQVDHVNPQSTAYGILFELLLKLGFRLSEPIAELSVAGNSVYSVRDGILLIYLGNVINDKFIAEISKLEPVQFICLDSAFNGNDQLKANAMQTFRAQREGHDSSSQITFKTV